MQANGDAIRALRRANGCGLRALSEQTGLNRGFLSQIETGKRGASVRTLTTIATALDVPIKAITSGAA
jgi:HTH-type transcriptional regulator, competence development regulator